VFQEGEWLSAQCLEYDIATQAKTLDGLISELQRILRAHIATSLTLDKKPFAGVPKAPQRFFDLFEQSKIPLTVANFGPPDLEIEIAPPELRVAALVPA